MVTPVTSGELISAISEILGMGANIGRRRLSPLSLLSSSVPSERPKQST
eukprot:CAMPEP_0170413428 /NCGR_PEP_ID=MMETSP0117_2-20130122/31520_1 /TAXON_ID=400756 /ORGANISM="Durinskia baltica, Strain CSIRO CS-38" /LENGTH=48 /DNA_ID= /DNA_START= /DNA_END= /DNA_ORIENTATION=